MFRGAFSDLRLIQCGDIKGTAASFDERASLQDLALLAAVPRHGRHRGLGGKPSEESAPTAILQDTQKPLDANTAAKLSVQPRHQTVNRLYGELTPPQDFPADGKRRIMGRLDEHLSLDSTRGCR